MEKQMLEELRKQTAIITKHARHNRISMFVAVILLFGVLGVLPFVPKIRSWTRPISAESDSWKKARCLHEVIGKEAEGVAMVQRLIKKHPDYDYGYALLGWWQQELGNMKEAESNYAKACDLFPSEQNTKTLAAIRKAIENKKAAANQVSEDTTRKVAKPHH